MKPLEKEIKLNINIGKVMNELVSILVPLGICVVMPVMVMWFVARIQQNAVNKRTEIMLKAIESGVAIDPDLFGGKQRSESKKERLLKRLVFGCLASLLGILLAVMGIVQWVNWDGTTSNDSFVLPLVFAGIFLSTGVALVIGFCVGRKMLAREIEAEDKALEQK